MEYKLNNLKLLAQGGEAEIYEIDEDKILRILRRKSSNAFEAEKKLFPILTKHDISIPAVYNYIEIDNRSAEIMQKIKGQTMLEFLLHHPLKMIKVIKKFAKMHIEILSIDSDCDIQSINNVVDYFLSKPPIVDRKLIDFTLQIFNNLPKTKNICHGDFHPGNILIQDDRDYIIDWAGAYRSSFISDIAHTYLLLTNVPKLPGQSHLQHKILSFFGTFMANKYLREIFKLKKIDLAEFSKWTVVMSLLRYYYGQPSEKDGRIHYIEKCYELNQKNVDASLWYKYL